MASPGLAAQTLLVHITYHHDEARICYLREVLATLATYQFARVDAIVDTNCDAGEAVVAALSGALMNEAPRSALSITAHLHTELDDPFLLTWSGRPHLAAELEHFDHFMYLEDDIVVSWRAIECWAADTRILAPLGYLRGFVRTERRASGELIAIDFRRRVRRPHRVASGGRSFVTPPFPYHACWLYNREQMRELKADTAWHSPSCPWKIRERAAAGLLFSSIPNEVPRAARRWGKGLRNRALIPLDTSGGIDPDALIAHVAAKYAQRGLRKRRGVGTVAVDRLVRRRWFDFSRP